MNDKRIMAFIEDRRLNTVIAEGIECLRHLELEISEIIKGETDFLADRIFDAEWESEIS
jgi:hypothetical protein